MKALRFLSSFGLPAGLMAVLMAVALPAQDNPPERDDDLRELGVETTANPESALPVEEIADAAPVAPADEVEAIVQEVIDAIREDAGTDVGAEIEAVIQESIAEATGEWNDDDEVERRERGSDAGEVVRFFSNAVLPAGERASEVVAILGSVVIDGESHGEAVAILGNNTINGRTGGQVVAVVGDVTVNGHVGGEVVAVLGNVILGPEAVVEGEIVSVGGRVDRAPGAVVKGQVNQVQFLSDQMTDGLKAYVHQCVLKARPLAFGEDLGWLWTLMLAALACYFLVALVMPSVVVRSAQTMEQHPGMSLLTALLTAVITPIAMLVLSVTVVGPPILSVLMFGIGIFGKVVFLAWLGRRITEPAGWRLPAVAVLIGGAITLAIYLVPVLGFLFKLGSDMLGTGIVVYTIILSMQENRDSGAPSPSSPAPAPTSGSVPPPAPAAPASGAAAGAQMGAAAVGGSVVSDAASAPSPAAVGAVPPPPPAAPPSMPTGGGGATPPVQLSTLPRVGLWARLAATLIDMVALGVVTSIGGVDDYFVSIAALYFILMWGLKGTTLGGVVLGIKIVRTDDKPVDWVVALVRVLGAFLSLVVMGLGFLWVAWDPQRQSWHDKIAGTTIVKMPKGVSLI